MLQVSVNPRCAVPDIHWMSSLRRGYGDVGRLLTSVAAAGRHSNEYNNNNGGGGVVREDVDGRRMLSGGKPAAAAAGDDGDRPLNLEVHKRPDTKLERPDSHNVERDSISGKDAFTQVNIAAVYLSELPLALLLRVLVVVLVMVYSLIFRPKKFNPIHCFRIIKVKTSSSCTKIKK